MKKILIAGDLFPTPINESLFIKANIESLFDKKIVELFHSADISVCNLEGTLTKSNQKTKKLGPHIKASQETLKAYKKLGVSFLATANNHVTDFCQQGYIDTKNAIDEIGLHYIGSGISINDIVKSKTFNLDGYKVCFYNVAETMFNVPTKTRAGVNIYDEYVVCKDLECLKRENDLVIVLYHGGVECFPYPTLELKKRFHRMADSGADIITAQHTHCIGCEELYKNSYLLYGQGNFLFDREHIEECTKSGLALEIKITDDNHCQVVKHLVATSEGRIRYISNPDFSEFEERGKHIGDDDFLIAKFKDFAMTQKNVKTKQFVNKEWYDSILLKLLSKGLYKKFYARYRTVHFSERQLMRILYTVISEQQRETALYMVLKELEQKNIKL